MDWLKIGAALLLGMMAIMIYPRMKHMIKNTPKAESGDWRTFVFLICGVILFVLLLVNLV